MSNRSVDTSGKSALPSGFYYGEKTPEDYGRGQHPGGYPDGAQKPHTRYDEGQPAFKEPYRPSSNVVRAREYTYSSSTSYAADNNIATGAGYPGRGSSRNGPNYQR